MPTGSMVNLASVLPGSGGVVAFAGDPQGDGGADGDDQVDGQGREHNSDAVPPIPVVLPHIPGTTSQEPAMRSMRSVRAWRIVIGGAVFGFCRWITTVAQPSASSHRRSPGARPGEHSVGDAAPLPSMALKASQALLDEASERAPDTPPTPSASDASRRVSTCR